MTNARSSARSFFIFHSSCYLIARAVPVPRDGARRRSLNVAILLENRKSYNRKQEVFVNLCIITCPHSLLFGKIIIFSFFPVPVRVQTSAFLVCPQKESSHVKKTTWERGGGRGIHPPSVHTQRGDWLCVMAKEKLPEPAAKKQVRNAMHFGTWCDFRFRRKMQLAPAYLTYSQGTSQ